MAIKISMPKLSDTMEEGLLVKWLKKEGEPVEAGEIIAEVESDKANMELEAYDSGIIRKLVVKEGDKVKIGELMAIIGEKDEDIEPLLSEPAPAVAKTPEPHAETAPIPAAPIPVSKPGDKMVGDAATRIKASPLARKLAVERGIDLSKVQGSGPAGRIIKRDIEAHIPVAQPTLVAATPAVGKEQDLTMMRQVIAQRMTQSKTTVPHFYLTMDIDWMEMLKSATTT